MPLSAFQILFYRRDSESIIFPAQDELASRTHAECLAKFQWNHLLALTSNPILSLVGGEPQPHVICGPAAFLVTENGTQQFRSFVQIILSFVLR